MTTHTSAHQKVIAAALEDWWITTDPTEPFDPATVAANVEQYLLTAGYYIAPDTGIPPMHTPARRSTCDASLDSGFTNPLGPCVLRHRHDGPLHKDASGATWWAHHTPAPPSRTSVAVTAVLALACLAGGLLSLTRDNWFWAIAGGTGAFMLSLEVRDELAERRTHRRGGPR